jgi:hypothetical protein
VAHKKVSYTPKATITYWNIQFCMLSNFLGSSFSATYHKSNTGGLQTTSSISLDKWFSRRCKNVANFPHRLEWDKFLFNSFWENSTNLSLYTDASGTLSFRGIFRTQWFQGKWLPHQTLNTKNIRIDWQELYVIVVASYIWVPVWAQKRIVFYCDNQAVVS